MEEEILCTNPKLFNPLISAFMDSAWKPKMETL